MIEKYPDYFQKSKFFLYPLLCLDKKMEFFPETTFLTFSDEDITPGKIICQFKIIDSPKFRNFERLHVIPSKYFICKSVCTNDEYVFYTFINDDYLYDYDLFLKGEYSQFTNEAKTVILKFYNVNTVVFEYIRSFLLPSKFYEVYSEILDVDENILKANVELCQKYDESKEICTVKVINLDLSLIS
jgi:hypothetical protein